MSAPAGGPRTGSQIEVIFQAEPGKRPVGTPIRQFKCSRCSIYYSQVFGPKATIFGGNCPLCKAEADRELMRTSMVNLTAKVELLEKQNGQLDGQVNIQRNFKDALEIIGDDDRTFLKSILYQWRANKSVTMKVTHNTDGRAVGLLADHRYGDPEAHTCTSIGGMAVVAYYEQAMREMGSAKAMQLLLRSAQHLLPGASS